MKSAICIMLACSVLVTVGSEHPSHNYISKSIDWQKIVDNKPLLQSYVNCFMDADKCRPDAKKLKEMLPQIVATSCAKCSPKQKEILRVVSCAMQKQMPKDWDKLQKKYDHTGKHHASFKSFIDCKQKQHIKKK